MKKHSIGTLVALTTTVLLSGCALYFGDENDRGHGNGVSSGGSGGAAPPGQFDCQDNSDCAAGCYSANNVCQETGFCTQDSAPAARWARLLYPMGAGEQSLKARAPRDLPPAAGSRLPRAAS